jgi:hypothetical protein
MVDSGILGMFLSVIGAPQLSFIAAIISIVFGLLVLWKPSIIAYLVGLYLVLIGLLAILASL